MSKKPTAGGKSSGSGPDRAKRSGQRDLAATRRRILGAAAREFAEKGLQGGRIDAIAHRSRANKAMIYYIFGKKDALHLAVLEDLFEEKTRNLDTQLLENPIEPENLLSLLSAYFDAFLANPDATRMIFHDLASGGRALKRLKEKRPDLFEPFRQISRRLDRLGKEGRIRPLDADKGLLTAVVLLMGIPVLLPHADLLSPEGTRGHARLSSPDLWKRFLADILVHALTPPAR